MRTYILMGMALLVVVSAAAGQTTAPATAPGGEGVLPALAGQSLLASAMEGDYNVRLLALAQMAERLTPDDAATERLLGELYELVGKDAQLASRAWAAACRAASR